MLSFCGHSEQDTQAIFFDALVFKNSIKNIRIRKFEHDIFSVPFTMTSSDKKEKCFFLIKIRISW